ncbi:MAG: heat-inducible transcriptional repressor HrcA [Methylocystaceae bacterium]
MQLDERKKRILEAVIREYVKTAEPVGSRSIARQSDLGVSAATVRNEMSDLEEMGYLEQPHTSAGRIPSEKGFRYFVDCMMEPEELTDRDQDFLRRMLGEKINGLEDLVQQTSNVLSNFSHYASLVISPAPQGDEGFRKMELIPLEPGRALLVLITDKGMIMHRKLDVDAGLTMHDLEQVSTIFNQQLVGTRIKNMRTTVLQSLRHELLHRRQLMDAALEVVDDLLVSSQEDKIRVSGALNILNEPEFKDLDKLKRILGVLEEEQFIKKLLEDKNLNEVKIKIGQENEVEQVRELSIVFTAYELGDGTVGRIGLIGPVRMQYWRASATVNTVRNIIQDMVDQFK